MCSEKNRWNVACEIVLINLRLDCICMCAAVWLCCSGGSLHVEYIRWGLLRHSTTMKIVKFYALRTERWFNVMNLEDGLHADWFFNEISPLVMSMPGACNFRYSNRKFVLCRIVLSFRFHYFTIPRPGMKWFLLLRISCSFIYVFLDHTSIANRKFTVSEMNGIVCHFIGLTRNNFGFKW